MEKVLAAGTVCPLVEGAVERPYRLSAGHLKRATFLPIYGAMRQRVGSIRISLLNSSEPPMDTLPGHQLWPGNVLLSSGLGGKWSVKSRQYWCMASIICLPLFMHRMPCALILALPSTGSNSAARMATMA